MLYAVLSTKHYPNVIAVAKALAAGNPTHYQQLVAYAKNCVEPAYNYFCSKADNDLKPVLDAFKAARYFSPSKFHELKPSAGDIDCLRAFPFLNSSTIIDGLKSEVAAYLAPAEDVFTQIDPIVWWKLHETELPNWAKACRMVLLVQPSSAAAEWVFFHLVKLLHSAATVVPRGLCRNLYHATIQQSFD